MIALHEDIVAELPTHFIGRGQVRGFKFRQICVTNRGFLYEVNTGHMMYYEVFKKKVNTQYDCVSYPRSKSFGIWAWTTTDIKQAFNILESFQERILIEAI